jgi:hypothetical protein
MQSRLYTVKILVARDQQLDLALATNSAGLAHAAAAFSYVQARETQIALEVVGETHHAVLAPFDAGRQESSTAWPSVPSILGRLQDR